MATFVSWAGSPWGLLPWQRCCHSRAPSRSTGFRQAGGCSRKAPEKDCSPASPDACLHLLCPQEQRPAPPHMLLESRPPPPALRPEAPTASQHSSGNPTGSTELSQGSRQHSIWPPPAAAAGEPVHLTPHHSPGPPCSLRTGPRWGPPWHQLMSVTKPREPPLGDRASQLQN